MLLGAYPREWLRSALKDFMLAARENRLAEGWALWTGDGTPQPPMEWRRIADKIYFRAPPPASERVTVSATAQRRARTTAEAKMCPFCGAAAFPQSVCPKCAKGKAGIRKQYICGEHDAHIFYTE